MGQKYHFSTYTLPIVLDDSRRTSRKTIVIKNEYGQICCFTDFHRYVKNPDRSGRKLLDDGNNRFIFVCQFLNYIFYQKYSISKLTDVKVEMFQSFMTDYGTGKLPGDKRGRAASTTFTCMNAVMNFLRNVAKNNRCKFKASDLYVKIEKRNRHGKIYMSKQPNFNFVYDPETREIFRDIPSKAFYIILEYTMNAYPQILMLVALQAFAGLRPSEACNVRREDSPLGRGLYFRNTFDDNVDPEYNVDDIRIDLTKEYNLRSDLVSVGKIKKERWQKVYPPFINLFMHCYRYYMDMYMKDLEYETDYGPLSVNVKNIRAMTYGTYKDTFQKMIGELIPVFLKSDDSEVVSYGQMLQAYKLSPHVFRHWFSVQLTIRGEDVGSLQYWRGDKSPESALAYLQNKSDLEHQYRIVNDELGAYMSWKAGKLHDQQG